MAGIIAVTVAAGGVSSPSTIVLDDEYISAFEIAPNTAEAGVQIDSDGFVYSIVNGVTSQIYQWCNPAANASQYECYATLVVGSSPLSSGNLNTWESLGSDRSWTTERLTAGYKISTITIGIRAISGGGIIDSATFELYAQVDV